MKKRQILGKGPMVIMAVVAFFGLGLAPNNIVRAEGEEVTVEERGVEEQVEVPESLDFGVLAELGRSYTKTLKIENRGLEKVAIDMSVEKYAEEGLAIRYTEADGWLYFVGGITHYEIEPGHSVEVPVRVLVPKDAGGGSQYATIIVKVAEGSEKRVFLRMDVAGEGLKYGGELVKHSIAPLNLLSSAEMASVEVKNAGTEGFIVEYSAKIETVWGLKQVKAEKTGKREAKPGQEVRFVVPGEDGGADLVWGIFRVEQTVSYVNGEGEQVKESISRVAVNVPWWAVLVAGVLVVAGVVLIVMRRRRKSNKKSPKVASDKDGESGET